MTDALMQQIAETARSAIPAVDEASVTFTRGDDRGWTVAYTGDLALRLDEAQYESHGGPCMDASQAGEVLVITDFRDERRWPEYIARAVQTDGRSSLSVPMPVQSSVLAALNLYSRQPAAFGDGEVEAGRSIAGLGAVAVTTLAAQDSAEQRASQLEEAMQSRAVIEQAKGVIMATTRCRPDQAFELLRAQSQAENRKLRDIAADIVRQQAT